DADEAGALIEQLPQAEGLSAQTRAALIARAEGVPLFLEELSRGLAEDPEGQGPVLPTTLSEVITARLDRVGPDAKRVAQAASVIGRTFDRPTLVVASGLDDLELDHHVERLSEHAVIETTGRSEELQFRHALF